MMMWILDLILPRHNSSFSTVHGYLDQAEISLLLQSNKQVQPPDKYAKFVDRVFSSCDYKNSLISDLIQRAKFFGETAISYDLGILLAQKLKNQNLKPTGIVCFVPPDPSRFSQRGFHLPKLIAQTFAQEFDLPLLDLLTKTKSTKPQVKLNKDERIANLEGVFELVKLKSDMPEPEIIWLIDDVTTTFTTLGECSKLLKQNFEESKIYCLTVAG
jgi:competence protein ComFC